MRDQDVGRSLVALLPVVPPVSPTLAAAEGHLDSRSIPSVNGESAERSARLPHLLMSVGRLSQGGQWPKCFRLVVRVLWCAPLSERGWVQHRSTTSSSRDLTRSASESARAGPGVVQC